MIALQVENLSKKFNQKVIFEKLTFTHKEGVLGISGANGSGKSTLMKCLAYLLKPNTGKITWSRNQQPLSREEVKSSIGYSAPYINLYSELTVSENLEFLMKVSEGTITTNLSELQQKVHISHLKDQFFGSLSTGQQQRVKLASALFRKPEILFLDEPGSNLDEIGQDLVNQIIREHSTNGTLVIVASNNPEEIKLCDQVVQLGSSLES